MSPALFQAYLLYGVFSLHTHALYLSSEQAAPKSYKRNAKSKVLNVKLELSCVLGNNLK